VFIYYITRPIHRRVANRVVPTSSLAATVSLLSVALPILLLIGYTVYVGVFQLAAVAESANLQPVLDALQPYIEDVNAGEDPQAVLSSVLENPRQFLSGGVRDALEQAIAPPANYVSALGNALIQLFVVLALAFYLLRDDHKLAAWFRTELADEGTPVYVYLNAVDRNLKTIYFGNILNAFATAILATISYKVLNAFSPAGVAVPSPTLLGLLTGVGSLVPVIGMKIVYVPAAIILAVEAFLATPALLWFPVVFAAVSLVIVDTIPDLILRPYVSGRSLHTGSVMIAYIIGPLLFGWYGLFLGPLLLVLIVHFARILLPELVRGEPATAQATAGNPLDPNDDIIGPEPKPADPDAGESASVAADSGASDADRETTRDGDESDHSSTDGASLHHDRHQRTR
jgi:predicted PurR-regulated permease PerM